MVGVTFQALLAGGGKVSSLAFQASSTSTGVGTITLPACQAGDLIVLLDKISTLSLITNGTPTGFTQIRSDSVPSDYIQDLYYKIAVGADSGATVTSGITVSSRVNEAMVALVFRANLPIASVSVTGSVGVATTGDPAAQTIVATGAVVPCVSVVAVGSSGAITGESYTGSGVDSTVAANTSTHFSYKVWSAGSSPTSLTADEGDAGTNGISGCFLSVS
jgi:hypothetical protein